MVTVIDVLGEMGPSLYLCESITGEHDSIIKANVQECPEEYLIE